MIPNHAQFIAASQEQKKVWLRFYSTADRGVLDRVCAPMNYGPSTESKDGLNRYWLWDYESKTGAHALGLLPQQIVELKVLGAEFDPAQFRVDSLPAPVAPVAGSRPANVGPLKGAGIPIL